VTPEVRVNSTGRRNTSSVEVSDGQAFGLDDDADRATGDALTGVFHPSVAMWNGRFGSRSRRD
jgi:hypothetical protein